MDTRLKKQIVLNKSVNYLQIYQPTVQYVQQCNGILQCRTEARVVVVVQMARLSVIKGFKKSHPPFFAQQNKL